MHSWVRFDFLIRMELGRAGGCNFFVFFLFAKRRYKVLKRLSGIDYSKIFHRRFLLSEKQVEPLYNNNDTLLKLKSDAGHLCAFVLEGRVFNDGEGGRFTLV